MNVLSPEIVASVTDIDAAFGGGYKYLPKPELIPAKFHETSNPFHRLTCDLMYRGEPGPNTPPMVLNEAYDSVFETIPKFMRSILGSFQPKHEHKIAGAAMLLSEMFTLVDTGTTTVE